MTKARDIAGAAPAPSTVSATEIGYLDGVSSAIQTQIDGKSGTSHNHNSDYIAKTLTTTTGDIIYASAANTPARLGIGSTNQVLTVSGGIPAWAAASSGALTLITATSFTNSTEVALNNCFSSTYQNYVIHMIITSSSAATDTIVRMRASGSNATGSNYYRSMVGNHSGNAGGSVVLSAKTGQSSWNDYFIDYNSSGISYNEMTIFRPFDAAETGFVMMSMNYANSVYYLKSQSGAHSLTNSYDGISFIPSSGNITGTIRVYGVSN